MDSEDFKKFFQEFQKFVEEDEKEQIANLIQYPLRNVENKEEFLLSYEELFNVKVKTAVRNQNIEQIWRNYQGVMIGYGEIWFSQRPDGNGYWIIAINNGNEE